MKYKKKMNIRKVLSMILCGVLLVGAVFGAISIGKKITDNSKTITPKFTVGSLDVNGEYVESKASLYTKDYFECKGLVVNLEFDSNVTYTIFYYDENNDFVSMSGPHLRSLEADVPLEAVYARLVITPLWSADIPAEDRVCHWYDTYKYTRQIEIRVLKKQDKEISLVDTLQVTKIDFGRENASVGAAPIEKTNFCTTVNPLELDDTANIELFIPKGGVVIIHFYDNEGRHLHSEEIASPSTDAVEIFEVDAEAGYSYVHFDFSLATGVEISDYEIYFRD